MLRHGSTARGAAAYEYSNIQNFKYGTQVLTVGSNQALTPQADERDPRQLQPRHRAWLLHARQLRRRYSSAGFRLLSARSPRRRTPLSLLRGPGSQWNQVLRPASLGNNWQRQINVTDNLSRIVGAHQMKFGLDYRRITSKTGLYAYQSQAIFSTSGERSRQQYAVSVRDFQKRRCATRFHELAASSRRTRGRRRAA